MNAVEPLPLAFNAAFELLPTSAGSVALYSAQPDPFTADKLPPMLLVHSVNAAGSAAEMAPLFDYYRRTRSVYALDLPGFGHSDRTDREYTPRLMTDAVLACLAHIAARHGDGSSDVVALSLAGEFAVRAQQECAHRVRTLALISPTGFNGPARRYGPSGSTLGQGWLYRLLSKPLWRDAIFKGLTRPGVIRYFLERSWGSKRIDEALWQYDIVTTRQPGAVHAPLYFLSAYLFSRDINALYESVQCPVWVSMATRGDFTNYRGRNSVEGRAYWQFHLVEGGALPYFEDLSAFVGLLDPFLAAP
jgi:pimeloyl-ACP methyl ester carboxylesterase